MTAISNHVLLTFFGCDGTGGDVCAAKALTIKQTHRQGSVSFTANQSAVKSGYNTYRFDQRRDMGSKHGGKHKEVSYSFVSDREHS